MIDKLEESPQYQDIAETLTLKCEKVEILYENYNEDKLLECYEILDKEYSLKDTDLAKLLENLWIQQLQRCEKFALQGRTEAIKKEFSTLLKLESRSNVIGDLLRLSFYTSMRHSCQKKQKAEMKKILLEYMNIFGKDTEIEEFISCYTEQTDTALTLSPSQINRRPRDFWLYN
jgi:hypothetical protein